MRPYRIPLDDLQLMRLRQLQSELRLVRRIALTLLLLVLVVVLAMQALGEGNGENGQRNAVFYLSGPSRLRSLSTATRLAGNRKRAAEELPSNLFCMELLTVVGIQL